MFKFDVTKHMPSFILQDKNGYATAKAIEAGMQLMNDTIEAGLRCILDVDFMPEWRLDELAWENNCLYDYNADISVKREWIRNSIPMYRLFGTPEAIYQYVGNYFDDIDVEENWIYDGEPYHFRVTVEGDWTPEKEAWARKAIDTSKNTRSVLDSIRIGCKCDLAIAAELEVLARFEYPMTGTERRAGTWPHEAHAGVLDETLNTSMSADLTGFVYDYPLTGIVPDEAYTGVIDDTMNEAIDSEAAGYAFGYPVVDGTMLQGLDGELEPEIINATDTDEICAVITYKMCGADEI